MFGSRCELWQDVEVDEFDSWSFEKFAVGSAWGGRHNKLGGGRIFIARSSIVLSLFTVALYFVLGVERWCHYYTVDSLPLSLHRVVCKCLTCGV